MLGNHPNCIGGAGAALTGPSGSSVTTPGIAATQVAYGSAANAIKGEAAFVYVEASDRLQIGIATGTRLLIGTGTDSSNGAIQLATHTTSAGGIGFGTDVSLSRVATGVLALAGTGANAFLRCLGTATLELGASGTNGELTIYGAGSLLLKTNSGTTALTLDSSQNANLVGVLTAASGTATPAGGSTAARLLFGTTAGFGVYYGSGVPSVSAAQGSLYLRSNGADSTSRLYVNTNGTTGWTAVSTVT